MKLLLSIILLSASEDSSFFKKGISKISSDVYFKIKIGKSVEAFTHENHVEILLNVCKKSHGKIIDTFFDNNKEKLTDLLSKNSKLKTEMVEKIIGFEEKEYFSNLDFDGILEVLSVLFSEEQSLDKTADNDLAKKLLEGNFFTKCMGIITFSPQLLRRGLGFGKSLEARDESLLNPISKAISSTDYHMVDFEIKSLYEPIRPKKELSIAANMPESNVYGFVTPKESFVEENLEELLKNVVKYKAILSENKFNSLLEKIYKMYSFEKLNSKAMTRSDIQTLALGILAKFHPNFIGDYISSLEKVDSLVDIGYSLEILMVLYSPERSVQYGKIVNEQMSRFNKVLSEQCFFDIELKNGIVNANDNLTEMNNTFKRVLRFCKDIEKYENEVINSNNIKKNIANKSIDAPRELFWIYSKTPPFDCSALSQFLVNAYYSLKIKNYQDELEVPLAKGNAAFAFLETIVSSSLPNDCSTMIRALLKCGDSWQAFDRFFRIYWINEYFVPYLENKCSVSDTLIQAESHAIVSEIFTMLDLSNSYGGFYDLPVYIFAFLLKNRIVEFCSEDLKIIQKLLESKQSSLHKYYSYNMLSLLGREYGFKRALKKISKEIQDLLIIISGSKKYKLFMKTNEILNRGINEDMGEIDKYIINSTINFIPEDASKVIHRISDVHEKRFREVIDYNKEKDGRYQELINNYLLKVRAHYNFIDLTLKLDAGQKEMNDLFGSFLNRLNQSKK